MCFTFWRVSVYSVPWAEEDCSIVIEIILNSFWNSVCVRVKKILIQCPFLDTYLVWVLLWPLLATKVFEFLDTFGQRVVTHHTSLKYDLFECLNFRHVSQHWKTVQNKLTLTSQWNCIYFTDAHQTDIFFRTIGWDYITIRMVDTI